MVEEHYRNRHGEADWKVSKPIEDWYKQSIRDLSGLGIDENLMSREWRKVVQRANREDAKKERREAERVHREKMEKEKERGKIHHGRRKIYKYRGYYPPSESKDPRIYDIDIIQHHHHHHKTKKSKEKEKEKEPEKAKDKDKETDKPKGTPKWVICHLRSKHCSLKHEMVKCIGRCGLTACADKAHRCHKVYIDYDCSDPECEECKKRKEKQEAWEAKVANPKYEEKWVDCPCEDPWCRRKVLEIREIEKPEKPRFFV